MKSLQSYVTPFVWDKWFGTDKIDRKIYISNVNTYLRDYCSRNDLNISEHYINYNVSWSNSDENFENPEIAIKKFNELSSLENEQHVNFYMCVCKDNKIIKRTEIAKYVSGKGIYYPKTHWLRYWE